MRHEPLLEPRLKSSKGLFKHFSYVRTGPGKY